MTKEQLKIIFIAILLYMLVVILFIYREWITEYYLFIGFPLLIIGSYLESAYRKKPDKIIKLNIFIAIYIAVYAAFAVIVAIYTAINNVDLRIYFDFFDIIAVVLLLVLPIFFIEIKQAYINAGK